MRKKILLVLLGLIFVLEFIHFMSISQEEDATQKAHAPLVKTALDANTATKKAELAAYVGDRFSEGKKLKA